MPGVWDAMSARLADQAGHEVAFLSGLQRVGHAARPTRLRLPDPDGDGRGGPAGVPGGARADGDRRRRHGLRQLAQHHPHRRALGGRGGHRHVPGGPGVAQEVRPHGGQAGRRRSRTGWPSSRPPSATATTCTSPPAPTPGPRSSLDEAIERARCALRRRRRRRLHRGPRVAGRAGADRRGPARLRAGGQHDRVGQDPTAHPDRAARPRLRSDRGARSAASTPRSRPSGAPTPPWPRRAPCATTSTGSSPSTSSTPSSTSTPTTKPKNASDRNPVGDNLSDQEHQERSGRPGPATWGGHPRCHPPRWGCGLAGGNKVVPFDVPQCPPPE